MIYVTGARFSDVVKVYTSIGPDFAYGCRALLAEFDENVVDIARRYAMTLWPAEGARGAHDLAGLPAELSEQWYQGTAQAAESWAQATHYLQALVAHLETLQNVHDATYPHRDRQWPKEDGDRLVAAVNAVGTTAERVWGACTALMAGLRWLAEFTSELCRRPGIERDTQLSWHHDLVSAFHDALTAVGFSDQRWMKPILDQTRAAAAAAGRLRGGYAPSPVPVHDNESAWVTVEAAERGQCTRFFLRYSDESSESNIFRIAPLGGADDRHLMVDCTSQGVLAVAAGMWITRPVIVYGCPTAARGFVERRLAELSRRPTKFADHSALEQHDEPVPHGGERLARPDRFERLPNELRDKIVSHLDASSVGNLGPVNSELRPMAMKRAREEWSKLSLQLEVMDVRTFLKRCFMDRDHWLGRGLSAIAPTNVEVLMMIESFKENGAFPAELRNRISSWDGYDGWNLTEAGQRRLEKAYWLFHVRPRTAARTYVIQPRVPSREQLVGLQSMIFKDIKVRLAPLVASRTFAL